MKPLDGKIIVEMIMVSIRLRISMLTNMMINILIYLMKIIIMTLLIYLMKILVMMLQVNMWPLCSAILDQGTCDQVSYLLYNSCI